MVTPSLALMHEGYLYSKCNVFGWKKRWCVLRGRILLFYVSRRESALDRPPRYSILIEHFECITVQNIDVLSLQEKSGKIYQLKCDHYHNVWVKAIQQVLVLETASRTCGDSIAWLIAPFACRMKSSNGKLPTSEEAIQMVIHAAIKIQAATRGRLCRQNKRNKQMLDIYVSNDYKLKLKEGIEVMQKIVNQYEKVIVKLDILSRNIKTFRHKDDAICVTQGQVVGMWVNKRENVDEISRPETFKSWDNQNISLENITKIFISISNDEGKQEIHLKSLDSIDFSIVQFALNEIIRSFKTRTISLYSLSTEPQGVSLRTKSLINYGGATSSIGFWGETEKRVRDSCIRRFNLHPQKGIQRALDYGLICSSLTNDQKSIIMAGEVAVFLKKTKGLNKEKIGEYLGEPDPINLEVLAAYARGFDFKEKSFEICIRDYLAHFKLPGESQKIDRIMEAFARAFHEANSTVFHSYDTAHILAFSTIILNTDAHNPSMAKRKRMTKEEFIRNNRGINGGSDLPVQILSSLYDSITKNQIRTNRDREDEGNLFTEPDMCGWMRKSGGSRYYLLKRWFILSNNCLYYFCDKTDVDPIGFFPLENITIKKLENHNCKLELRPVQGVFMKSAKYNQSGNLVKGMHKNLILKTSDPNDCSKWLGIIEKCILKNNNSGYRKKTNTTLMRSTSNRISTA